MTFSPRRLESVNLVSHPSPSPSRPAGGRWRWRAYGRIRGATTLALVLGAAFLGAGVAAAADGETFAIEKTVKPATTGSATVASVAVVGKNGWHVNPDAPITLTLTADPGVTLPKTKLTRADLAETSLARARFDVAFTPTTPGTKKIAADAKFVMCQEQACKPVKETVTMEVAVADAAGAPAGATPGGDKGPAGTKPEGGKAGRGKSKAHPGAASPAGG